MTWPSIAATSLAYWTAVKEPKNEAALCAGAVAFLSKRRSERLVPVAQPDKVRVRATEPQREAVELVAESASALFVFEHTRIESFPEQIADGKAFTDLMEPLETSLAALLPTGTYELIIATGAASELRRPEFDAVRAAIARWAAERGRVLALGPDDDDAPDSPWIISETPRGVPFEVTLQRRPPDDQVTIFVARFSPAERDHQRRARINTAVERKCPKLAEAKREFGATSVLILESNDIALANRHVISATVIEAIQSRPDVPDIILHVQTDRGLAWQLWVLKDDERIYPEVEDAGPHDVLSPS